MVSLIIVILFIIIGVAFIIIAKLKSEASLLKTTQDQFAACETERQTLQEKVSTLSKENEELAQYKGITDIKGKIKEALKSAQVKYDQIKQEAYDQKAKTLQEADEILTSAKSKAETIIEGANRQADEIAGSAYDAVRNAHLYEQTAKAMKNVIEGYGDKYLIPSHNLIDDLAEEFGYTEAGEELKKARTRSREMMRNEIAATCEYVDQNKKNTAINFVIDAFNGKVDSILARVKSDNAGKLKQEICDAFMLVNYNGKAFREATITEDYLQSRLEELKWAAVAQELRLQEREEQRRMREQIREEQRAQKEYERAIREAAKEEDVLRKAMARAQQDVEQASAEQKAKYEAKLRELTEKLKEAEDKNQRAISMAQQTKRGHVYIISNIGSFGENVYKIGMTRRLDPIDRIRELGDASVPFAYDVHAMINSEDAPALENALHKHFVLMQINKVNHRKEFFRISLKDIREETEQLGIQVKWTMKAEAREYRESLAIEEAIREKPEIQEAWINRQLEMDSIDLNDFKDQAVPGDKPNMPIVSTPNPISSKKVTS